MIHDDVVAPYIVEVVQVVMGAGESAEIWNRLGSW